MNEVELIEKLRFIARRLELDINEVSVIGEILGRGVSPLHTSLSDDRLKSTSRKTLQRLAALWKLKRESEFDASHSTKLTALADELEELWGTETLLERHDRLSKHAGGNQEDRDVVKGYFSLRPGEFKQAKRIEGGEKQAEDVYIKKLRNYRGRKTR